MMAIARLRTGVTWINCRLLWISGAAIVVLGTTVLVSVVSRYAFDHPLTWTNDVARLALSVCIFCALPVAMEAGAHVAIDLDPAQAPRGLKLARDGVRWLILAGVVGLWCVLSLQRTIDALADGRSLPGMVLEVSAWVLYGLQTVLLLQFALTALVFPGGAAPGPAVPRHGPLGSELPAVELSPSRSG